LQVATVRALRKASLAGALCLALAVISTDHAVACATCVTATECDIDACEGAMSCSFDGPLVETETELECNFVTRLIFGCRVYYGNRLPSCRPSGGACFSTLPECNPGSDLEPDHVDPTSPGGDDGEVDAGGHGTSLAG
jgi:hypothetical protein